MAKKTKYKDIPVAVEIHSDFIKLVGLKYTKTGPVLQLVKKEFYSKENEDIFKEIAHLFKTHKFSTTKIYLNIPRHLVMERVLYLPATNDEEIREMVKLESARQMPYRDEDMIAGYMVIEKLKNGYSDILLAVVQESIVKRFINILEEANLCVEKIVLSSESLYGWYMFVTKDAKEAGEANVALINIDTAFVDMDIIEKGKPAFTRSFAYTQAGLCAGGQALEEIKRSIITYQRERKLEVGKIILSGATNRVKEIEPILNTELGLPVEVIEQERSVALDKSITADLAGSSFIELIGLSLRGKEMKINLFPESMIEDNKLQVLKKSLLQVLTLAVCLGLVLVGVASKNIFDKSKYLAEIRSKRKTIEPKVLEAKRMREDIKLIKSVVEKKPLAIDIIAEIYKVTPGGITFNLVDYESERLIILRGSAPSLDGVIKFIKILEASPYCENVKMKYTAKRAVGAKQLTDFEINAELSKVR
ncbi:MAG: pilus assembly protein PilM [Candidatus Omnitrophota bacterium]